jgi:hypothetical protein
MKFELVLPDQITYRDAELLEKARKHSWVPLSMEQFTKDIANRDVDVWKNRDGPECIIVTVFQVGPGYKHLEVLFLAGLGVKPFIKECVQAVWEIADKFSCNDVIFKSDRHEYAKRIGGEEMTRLYRLRRQ